MAVKMLTEYSAYDKVKKYKGKEIRYISKRRFKSLGLKEEVRGFFSTRKAKTEKIIVCNDIPFDLRANRKCRRIVGYVKGEDGGFYVMTSVFSLCKEYLTVHCAGICYGIGRILLWTLLNSDRYLYWKSGNRY